MNMLSKEAEDWWDSAHQRLEVIGTQITWVVFLVHFLEEYFLEDVCIKKEIEVLKLEQGNMKVDEYAAKFEDLVKFRLHYNNDVVEGSK